MQIVFSMKTRRNRVKVTTTFTLLFVVCRQMEVEMLINLSEIMSVPDKVTQMQCPIELSSFRFGNEHYEFAKKSPVALEIRNLGNRQVRIIGSISCSLIIPCSRCLTGVEVPFDIEVDREIDFTKTEEERAEELDETNYISGYNLDVDTLVYDEILIELPYQVLCKESCKGLCKVCGQNLNSGSCSCDQQVLDPRMAVIRDIFNNFKEV